METTIRATFARINDMQKAAEALKKISVIDLRVDGNTGSTLPDAVEFATEPLGMNAAGHDDLALWVSVEKSRFRHAEDTILACGGTVNISE
jgi:hypothetical protein